MVEYYLGNPLQKKAKLLECGDGVYLNNDEVLATYGKGDRYYYVTGNTIFGDFTVWEYMSYNKSLELRRPLRSSEATSILARVGVKVNLERRIKSLCVITQKAIKLALMLRPDTFKLYLNFDGLKYSFGNYRKMQRLLNALSCYEITVSVSDIRFVPTGGAIRWFIDPKICPRKAKIVKQGSQAIGIDTNICRLS